MLIKTMFKKNFHFILINYKTSYGAMFIYSFIIVYPIISSEK